jgi:hypothetical protein
VVHSRILVRPFAGSQFLWRDFPRAPVSGTWYPDALADRASGSDLNASNPADFDILANFSSTFSNWYFGTDGATPANQYDFFSVVLHELTHGLGFAGSANVTGSVGSLGFSGFPVAYDRFVVTESDAPLLGFVNPSVALGTQLTSGYNPVNPRGPVAYWGGPMGRNGNGGLSAPMLQNSISSYVAAWIMNGSGQAVSFVPVYVGDVGTWRVVATADLNNDGITDIVLQDLNTTYVGGWLMNSAGQAISFVSVHFSPTGSWRVVGSEDLNGDGITDILLQDSSSTYVAVWIMNVSGQPITFDVFYPGNVGGWRVNGRR